ncbi:MAG: hypothetical protein AB7L09_23595 [Nitrospira sp.]
MEVLPSSKPAQKPKVPHWATEHFELFVHGVQDIGTLVRITERGVSVLRAMPRVVKGLAGFKGKWTADATRKHLERAESDAARAQSELESDFPLLHGLAVIAIWSALEHFTKALVSSWILHRKDALAAPALQRLKVKLGEYLHLTRAEQACYLVELLEQDLSSPLKVGAGRFETLLEPFSLSGQVPADCSKSIFELQQVRNIIAHRNGRADKRFRTACPWIKVKLDKPVHVSGKMLERYLDEAIRYALEVFYRVGDRYGQDLRATKDA